MTDPALASGLVEGLVGAAVGIVVGGIAMKYGSKNGKAHHCAEHYLFVEKVSGLMADMEWVCTVLQQVYGHKIQVPRRKRGGTEAIPD
jgi:hypothetical protein